MQQNNSAKLKASHSSWKLRTAAESFVQHLDASHSIWKLRATFLTKDALRNILFRNTIISPVAIALTKRTFWNMRGTMQNVATCNRIIMRSWKLRTAAESFAQQLKASHSSWKLRTAAESFAQHRTAEIM